METPATANNEKSLNDFQRESLIKAENELNALREELANKKYLIDLNKSDIKLLNDFNKNDATWKFTECLGVVEIEKELKDALKSGKLYIGAMPIEAIYYYLSKVEGNGKNTNTTTFETVDDYIRVLKAMTGGMERVKADNDKIRNQEFVVASRREGIEPDSSIENNNENNN